MIDISIRKVKWGYKGVYTVSESGERLYSITSLITYLTAEDAMESTQKEVDYLIASHCGYIKE